MNKSPFSFFFEHGKMLGFRKKNFIQKRKNENYIQLLLLTSSAKFDLLSSVATFWVQFPSYVALV